MPAMGGKPEAMAMPKHRGKAMRNTRKPDVRSDFQFSARPDKPVLGKLRDWALISIMGGN